MPQPGHGAEQSWAFFEYARKRFLSLFNNRRSSIVRTNATQTAWRTVSEYYFLTDHQLMQAVSDEATLLRGCRWDLSTNYFVFDIDVTSPYHSAEKLYEITYKLKQIGLEKTCLFRSSDSGGWHLYIFLDCTFNSERLSSLLKQYMRKCGFELGNGILEIYPCGNALRLPLQSGFAWLDDKGQVISERSDLNLEDAVCSFVQTMDENTNDAGELLQSLERLLEPTEPAWNDVHNLSKHGQTLSRQGDSENQLADDSPLSKSDQESMAEFEEMVADAHDKMHDDRWRSGRKFWLEGLSSKNQRHEAMLAVGYYLWFGDASQNIPRLAGSRNAPQRERLLRRWIEEKHNGFCWRINRNKWRDVETEIKRAVRWVKNQTNLVRIPYLITERLVDRQMEVLLTVEQLERANQRREELAREKIADAVAELKRAGEDITRRALARVSGCSRNTIKRHADLWLSNGSGDLSSVKAELAVADVVLSAVLVLDAVSDGSSPSVDFLNPIPAVSLDANSAVVADRAGSSNSSRMETRSRRTKELRPIQLKLFGRDKIHPRGFSTWDFTTRGARSYGSNTS